MHSGILGETINYVLAHITMQCQRMALNGWARHQSMCLMVLLPCDKIAAKRGTVIVRLIAKKSKNLQSL